MRSSTALRITVTALLLVAPIASSAQMAHRLKGFVRTEAGAPVGNASIRADALSGFRGEPMAGQKDFTVTSGATGEWNLLGIHAGLWMFSTTAPDKLPAVVILPVKFSARQQVSAVGNSLTWPLPMSVMAAADHPMLNVASQLLSEGKREEAAQALTVALGPDLPIGTRVAAGEMALLVQQAALAKTIFSMVLQAEPKHPRATLGQASAALLGRDWEGAGKWLWQARDLAPKDQRPALAAAIDDIRGFSSAQ